MIANHWQRAIALMTALGLLALGGAGFGVWLLLVLDGASVVGALLSALAGFGVWTLIATGFVLALIRASRNG